MCFDDLWIDAGLDEGKSAAYHVKGAAPVTFGPGSERCTVVPAAAGYHVVTLRVKRAGEHTYGRRLDVHLVRDGRALRVVGLDR